MQKTITLLVIIFITTFEAAGNQIEQMQVTEGLAFSRDSAFIDTTYLRQLIREEIRNDVLENFYEEKQKYIESIEDTIKSLSKENNEIKKELTYLDSTEYEESIYALKYALENGDKLQSEVINFIKDRRREDLILKLMNIRSPTSNALGFEFIEIIKEEVATSITKDLPQKEKNLWGRIVSKITNNEFVATILKTNTVTNIVSNIVTSAANFLSIGNKAKEIDDGIKQDRINDFLQSITPYIDYYKELDNLVTQYQVNNLDLQKEYDQVIEDGKTFHTKLINQLGYKQELLLSEQLKLELKNKFGEEIYKFKSLKNDNKLLKAISIAKDFSRINDEFKALEEKYTQTFLTFLEGFQAKINSSETIFNNKIDKDKLKELENEITEVKELLVNGSVVK